MTTALLDVAGFSLRTVMPSEDVDYLEDRAPGFLAARLAINTSKIYGRLGKRYTPFVEPVPEIALGWLVALTTVDAYQKRGWNPADEQSQKITAAADEANAEMKEAADGVDGLFDLPLRADTSASGVVKGGPFVHSEQSPYEWMDAQREATRGR